jgi:hypothetical protein
MKFYITDNSWNEVKDNVNVDTIRQLFFDAVLPLLNSLDDCEETIITLPEIVTKNERYKISQKSPKMEEFHEEVNGEDLSND